MNLIKVIDYRGILSPDTSDINVVAKVKISTRNFLNQVSSTKEVEYIVLDKPLRITEHFVDTRDIPFIYATRKQKNDFNMLSTSGEGTFLCRDLDHLDKLLTRLEDDYDTIITEMLTELAEMSENNSNKYVISEVVTDKK